MEKSRRVFALALWRVKAGKEQEFITAWNSFGTWTMLNQPGTVGEAELIQDINDPQRMISFGLWEDNGRIQEWRQRPEFKAFFAQARQICDEIQPLTMKSVANVTSSD